MRLGLPRLIIGSSLGALGGGAATPRIILSTSSIAEDAASGSVVGVLSVANGSGSYTYSITADPDSKFAIDTANLETDATLNYEAATSHSVTIEADNGVDDPISRVFTIQVTNVYEAANLSALGFDDSELVQGASSTVNITSATSGSTLTASGLPAGMSINSGARTITGTPTTVGTGSATITETLADSANSPRDTVWEWEIVEAPAETFVQLVLHGDSNTPGTIAPEVEDTNDTGITQYVLGTGGTPDGGFPIGGTGRQANVFPLQHPFTHENDMLAPGNYLAKRILAAGYKVEIIGAGLPGGRIATDEPNLGPLPEGYAVDYAIPKATASLAAIASDSPSSEVIPFPVFFGGFNDMLLGADPDEVLANMLAVVDDYRTNITGYEDCKYLVVGVTPEQQSSTGGQLIEAALRISALSDPNGYYAIMPEGYGGLHIGDEGADTPGAQNIRDVGYDVMGRVALVALGLASPIAPNFTIGSTIDRTEGTDVAINLPCDQPVYYTAVTVGGSVVELSGDLAATTQTLLPVGGTYSLGTTEVTLSYRTGDGVEGTVSFDLVVSEAVSTTYYLFDDFNRADTSGSTTGLGSTSGSGGQGGSIPWEMIPSTGWGAISTNKAALPWNSSDNVVNAIADCGQPSYKITAYITVSGSYKPVVVAACDDEGSGIIYNAGGSFTSHIANTIGDQGELSALGDGDHKIEVLVDDLNTRAGLIINDVEVFPLTSPSGGPTFVETDTYVGFGNAFINDNTRFDNFAVEPLQQFAPSDDYSDILGSRLIRWVDAEDLSNGSVSSWIDRVTGTPAFTQGTSGSQPVRSATSFNGLPGVTFDGSDDFLSGTLTTSAGFRLSVFMSVIRVGGSESQARLVSLNDGSGNDYDDYKYIPLKEDGGGVVKPYRGAAAFGGETLVEDQPHVVGSVMLEGGHTMVLDGVIQNRFDYYWPGQVPTYAPSQIFVGANNNGGENANIIVKTLLVVDGLITRDEINAITARLMDEGGL